ncbi:hypothetical protein BV25DRAFT_1948613, partial [Artomyces pyxidatus]
MSSEMHFDQPLDQLHGQSDALTDDLQHFEEDEEDAAPHPADLQVDLRDPYAQVEPFAPNVVPPLVSTDPDDPDIVTDALLTRSVLDLAARTQGDVPQYYERPLRTYSLSKLKALYESRHHQNAMNILFDRVTLNVDSPQFVCPRDSPDVAWMTKGNFVDLVVLIPRGLGFSAILPRTDTASLTFDLQLSMFGLAHSWRVTKAMLGFDPKGSMLWVGHCSGQDVWLAMVPNELLTGEVDPVHVGGGDKKNSGDKKSSPALSTKAYRVMVYFFAYVLSTMHYRDINSADYPPLGDWDHFRMVNTLMQRRDHRFNLEQARKLSTTFAEEWENWRAGAPEEYNVDGIVGKSPIILPVRYGQNIRIGTEQAPGTPAEGELDQWDDHVAWDSIRYFTVALACVIGGQEVARWQDIADADVENENPEIYTGPDTASRERIENLAEFPRFDDDGREIPIFTPDGYAIPRREPFVQPTSPPSSILFDLPELGRRFNSAGESYDADVVDRELSGLRSECFGRDRAYPEVCVYPLGLLGSFGNMQASGAFPPFNNELRALCNHLRRPNQERDEDDEDEFGDPEDDVDGMDDVLAVEAISVQGYNLLSHRTRDSAKYHEAQLGLTGGAAAGTYATTPKAKAAARKLFEKNRYTLPHERFQEIIADVEDIPRDIRLETVIVVNMNGLRERHRTGSYILNEIIFPVATMWQRGKVWTEIRPCLRLFKADTFPQAINWTLYPITSMVDAMYKSVRTSKGPVDPYTVELLSQLDRVINFAHTGSPAVFVHGLMKKTWLSLGILEHGYPSLWAGAIRQNGRFERVNPVYW